MTREVLRIATWSVAGVCFLLMAACGQSSANQGDDVDWSSNGFQPPEDPSEVSVDYVDAVTAELDRLERLAFEAAAADGSLDSRRFRELLAAVYGPESAERVIEGLRQAGGVERLQPHPRGRILRATDVTEVRPDCIVAAAEFDQSVFLKEGNAPETVHYRLAPAPQADSPNPTPWIYAGISRDRATANQISCDT
ncbi:MAG: hypothetical protein ACRDU8_00010 [Egibacteraceae bacterium]